MLKEYLKDMSIAITEWKQAVCKVKTIWKIIMSNKMIIITTNFVKLRELDAITVAAVRKGVGNLSWSE